MQVTREKIDGVWSSREFLSMKRVVEIVHAHLKALEEDEKKRLSLQFLYVWHERDVRLVCPKPDDRVAFLKWAHGNQFVCEKAASQQNIEVFEWSWHPDSHDAVFRHAAIMGHVSMFKSTQKLIQIKPFFDLAAQHGRLELLKWFHDQGYRQNVCRIAAWRGDLPMLQWAVQVGYEMDYLIPEEAAENGALELLKWALTCKCELDLTTSWTAARFGHADVLLCLVNAGCDFTQKITYEAAKNGKLNVLIWSKTMGLDPSERDIYTAVENGHIEVVKWLLKEGISFDKEKMKVSLNRIIDKDIQKKLQDILNLS